MTPAVRAALAIAISLLILTAAAAPHTHGGNLGTHGCLACVTAGGDETAPQSTEVVPRPAWHAVLPGEQTSPPVTGAPLGAIPGQSPPCA